MLSSTARTLLEDEPVSPVPSYIEPDVSVAPTLSELTHDSTSSSGSSIRSPPGSSTDIVDVPRDWGVPDVTYDTCVQRPLP